ncbi:MAG TPA: dienelactone hydrolase family protein [Caulobacteraceae bacterium]
MGESTTIEVEDGRFNAYVAHPAVQSAPAIVVIQEIFGVNAVMRGIADKLAAEGCLALCPDLFWRIEPGIELSDRTEADMKRAFEFFAAFDVDRGVKDIAATIGHARTFRGASGAVGAVGFCLGGLLAFLAAARTPAQACVAFYGVGIDRHAGEATGGKPLMLHIAEKDQFVPPAAQRAMISALGERPGITLHSYPGCDHAFAREGGENYDPAAADLAWKRTMDFFAGNL